MPHIDEVMRNYEELAYVYERQGQPKLRDWFLVLAADAAVTAGVPEEAERLRNQLLAHNPHHLLKPFASFAEALQSPDIQSYIADLRRTYPPEEAEEMLGNKKSDSGLNLAADTFFSAVAQTTSQPKPAAKPAPKPAPAEEPRVYKMPQPAREERREPKPAPKPAAPAAAPAPAPQKRPQPAPPAPAAETRLPPPAPPRPQAPPKPAVKSTPGAPSPGPALTPPWAGSPPPSVPTAATPRVRTPEESDYALSQWTADILFGVVLLAGAAGAAYMLARPLLPAGWLP